MTGTRQSAFTLIEVLVALAIFGVMSLLAYAALGSSLSSADMLTERMDRLQAIQRSVRQLSSDILQTAPRSVRGQLGDALEPALQTSIASEFAIELTHGGWTNPAGLPRGTLQRTAYRLEDDQLVRYYWRVLDRTYANEPVATVLLDEVDSLYFRFYQEDGEASDVWPPESQLGANPTRTRPRAVEIVLVLTDEGEVTRLIEVAP